MKNSIIHLIVVEETNVAIIDRSLEDYVIVNSTGTYFVAVDANESRCQ